MEEGKSTRMAPLHSIVHALGFSYDWLSDFKRKGYKPKPFIREMKQPDGSFLIRDQDTGKLLGRLNWLDPPRA